MRHVVRALSILIAVFTITAASEDARYDTIREGLPNSRVVFERHDEGRVAFLGGSITQMSGWRDLVMEDLERRYPDTRLDFVQAGVASMGSTPGAFRLARDVFGRGPVDLLFVEAAVNDSTNGRTRMEPVRGMEGIVRHARHLNPAIDIVFMYFVDPGKMAEYTSGMTPEVIEDHERVAEHYGIPSLNLALEVTERIAAGEFTWEVDFKDLHPAPFGHRLYATSIARLLDTAWGGDGAAELRAWPMPVEPLDAQSYDEGRVVSIENARDLDGFSIVPRWAPADGAGTRPGFTDRAMLVGETPGASFSFAFEGRAVGVWVAAGPDAGTIGYSIDGGPEVSQDLYTQWSGGLHLPWAYILDGDLAPGAHRVQVRILEGKNPKSTGFALRVAHFLVNGPG